MHLFHLLIAVSAGAAFYNVVATVRLIRFAGYSTRQKQLQLALIWMVPILGAWLVSEVIRSSRRLQSTDTRFIRDNGSNPPGIGVP